MPRSSRVPWKGMTLVFFLLTGVILDQTGVLDWHAIRSQLEPVAGQWWLPPLIVSAQTLLYALAMPGSAMILLIALLYPPLPATLISVAGGLAGALIARHMALKIGHDWSRKADHSPTYRLLERHSGLLTLCLVRILPGFPHSVINTGCGLLRVPLPAFVLSTMVGFFVKSYLYAAAIYEAGKADEAADLMRLETLWPLIALAALLGSGHLFRYFWLQRRKKKNS